MHNYLPQIQANIPGCGITVWNVWSVPFIWWRQYTDLIDQLNDERSKK